MPDKNYLIFDLGASNGRAMVATYDGRKVSMDVTHRFDNRPVSVTGTLYWDVLYLYTELMVGLQKSLNKYPDIISLAVDTWGCDFGMIDEHGKLVANPLTYRDQKRHDRSRILYQTLPERELFKLSAGCTNLIMGIFQLFSFKYEDALEIRCGKRLLMIPDLLNYFLTGRSCNEYTNATMTLLCDQVRKSWETRILDRLEIDHSILGELVMPGDRIGCLTEAVCAETGANPLPVIAAASHDTASAVAGIPLVDVDKHWAFISMGTWSIMGMETPEPMISDKVFDAGYGNNAIPEGRNMMVTYITGLWIIQQCRKRWLAQSEGGLSWDEIVRASEQSGPARAFIDVDDPVFGHPQADMPATVREVCEQTGQGRLETMGEIARCLYESLVLKYRLNVTYLERITGRKLELIHIMGGGTQNKTLCRWIADATGIPVIAGPTETTSMGNLLMQMKADGEIHGLAEGREISLRSSQVDHYEPEPVEKTKWDDAYGKYLELHQNNQRRDNG